ncbi:MAG: hypothetical protein O7C75_02690 [Verrucomicrobia bacterium]|nr:hypothetical protein [Verrucomicrobiota bacterium]
MRILPMTHALQLYFLHTWSLLLLIPQDSYAHNTHSAPEQRLDPAISTSETDTISQILSYKCWEDLIRIQQSLQDKSIRVSLGYGYGDGRTSLIAALIAHEAGNQSETNTHLDSADRFSSAQTSSELDALRELNASIKFSS